MDLTKLLSNVTNKIDVDEVVVFPKEYYENTDIVELKPVHVTGTIHKNYNDEIILNLDADGNMVLEDAISLEPVLYPFQVHLEDEVIENAVLSYIEPYASSTCEMVAEILQYFSDGE